MGAFSIRSQPAVCRERGVVEIRGATVVVGRRTARFDPADPLSALCAYLYLVRAMRDQRRDRSILLRRDDVVVLASALGESAEAVLDELGTLMGATRAQRGAMATLFAAGALVVGIAGTTAVVGHGDGSATIVSVESSTPATASPAGWDPSPALAGRVDSASTTSTPTGGHLTTGDAPPGAAAASSSSTAQPAGGGPGPRTVDRGGRPAPPPITAPRPASTAVDTTILIAGDPPIPTPPDSSPDPVPTSVAPPATTGPDPTTTTPGPEKGPDEGSDEGSSDLGDDLPEETIEEPWLVIDPPIADELPPPAPLP